jgi:hypothetical protein
LKKLLYTAYQETYGGRGKQDEIAPGTGLQEGYDTREVGIFEQQKFAP